MKIYEIINNKIDDFYGFFYTRPYIILIPYSLKHQFLSELKPPVDIYYDPVANTFRGIKISFYNGKNITME